MQLFDFGRPDMFVVVSICTVELKVNFCSWMFGISRCCWHYAWTHGPVPLTQKLWKMPKSF